MLSGELIGIIGFASLFLLLILRVPVGLAMVGVGIGGNFFLSLVETHFRFEPFIKQFKNLTWGTVANYDLSVLPLFILMGYLATQANLSKDLFQGLNAMLGRFKGGVAMASIGACAGFGAVCGSSLATASTMGRIALPELDRLKYSPRLATGTLAAGGTLGILIPPSVALVIYATIVEASIIDMFQAAIIPGLIAVIFFIGVIAFLVRRNPSLAPQSETLTKQEKHTAYRRLIPVVAIFGSIILGLGFGLFTPTSAAGVGAMIMMLYGFYLKFRKSDQGLSMLGLKTSILDTAVTSGMIYFILFGAEVLKIFFTRAGLPSTMATFATTSGIDPWMMMILILFILIVLGCFMDSLAMILVVLPFFWPSLVEINGGDYATAASAAYGMSTEDLKIWFGIVCLVVIELGLITPPIGLNVFIISSIAKKVSMSEVFKGVLPFFGIEIIRIGLLLAVPTLSLFLPHYL